ncbi:hypothetical protein CR513_23034, partial [Mucuna pruriens]
MGRHEDDVLRKVLRKVLPCLQNNINQKKDMWYKLLIQYFYKGMILMDKSMIDVASGRALMDQPQLPQKI